jgi:hypothetical protein
MILIREVADYLADNVRCSPFLGPKNSMIKVDRCLLKMGL